MKKKIIIGSIVVLLVGVVGYIGLCCFSGPYSKADEKTVLSMLNSSYTAAEISFAELGEYPKTMEEVGFMVKDPAYKISYTSYGQSYLLIAEYKGIKRAINEKKVQFYVGDNGELIELSRYYDMLENPEDYKARETSSEDHHHHHHDHGHDHGHNH